MKTNKLKSVPEGIEMGLSTEQCRFIVEEMKKYDLINGVYYDSTQGANYGFLAFNLPKICYFNCMGNSEWKSLQTIAKKSNTTMRLMLPQIQIRFYATDN